MTYTLTEEQLAIIAAATDTEDNILVSALAGAAKTSTLEEIAKALPDTQILCLAFNKKIADEMQRRLPPNCKAMTLNALGHRTWSEATDRRIRIESSKGYTIMRELIDTMPQGPEKQAAYDNMAELMRVVAFGKACGYIPSDHYERAKRLMDDDDFFNHLPQELADWEIDLVRRASLLSLEQAFQGLCDYDDQILMPTVFHGAFPRYPLVLVDEAQDLSALNHAMLQKLAKKRLIAVGDQCQAIYGFRGAHKNSMTELRHAFRMKERTLSISFRCPIEVVKAARFRAPNMKYPDWAQEGSVSSLASWSASDLPEDAAVICRNNAPLFALAIKLLKQGRTCELGGNDVAKGVMATLRKFGSSDMKQIDVLARIDVWEEEQLAKTRHGAKETVSDKAACMRIFVEQGATLGDAMAYAQHLMQLHSPLKLMTGHKAKGLEFEHVFFLDQELLSRDGQDPNIRYVIITRSKSTLTFVNLEDFKETVDAVAA